MKLKIYNFLVNRHIGIKERYHSFHDNASGIKKALSWIYLFWLNFAYYILFCRFLGKAVSVSDKIYEEKKLLTDISESMMHSKKLKSAEEYVSEISEYEVITFDIFDTLIFRPFSSPQELFYFIGNDLGFMDFKRIRSEAEARARVINYDKKGTYECTLKDIWKVLSDETGLDAESGMELEEYYEMKFCYANPYMKKVFNSLREMGKEIYIISDMYLSSEFLKKMLEANGITGYRELYVSCEYDLSKADGRLFSYVADKHKLNERYNKDLFRHVMHIGDNKYSDIKMAKRAGFGTKLYPNVNYLSEMYRAYDMSPLIGGAYRGIVNNYLYSGCNIATMEYEYGFIYGGLFVLGYCNFIHDYVVSHNIDKVLFLSRDGDILKQVYEKMYPCENIEYVYWSRRAATKLMAGYNKYDYVRRFVEHKVNQNISIEKIFISMELVDLVKHLKDYGIDKNDSLTDKNVKRVKEFLNTHWGEVTDSYEEQKTAAGKYYAQVLKGCTKAVAVDIGWAGSGAVSLNTLVNKKWGLGCDITGIIAGTNTIYNFEYDINETFIQTGKLVSYMYSYGHNRDLVKIHDANKNYNVYWELLLSSPTRQFKGFTTDISECDEICRGVGLIFGDYDENQEGIKSIRKGILDFVNEYIEHFGEYKFMYAISGRDAYAPMLVAASYEEKYLKEVNTKFNLEINAG